MTRPCDHPGCPKPGEYPAPKSVRDINDRYYFCLEHVREYNRSWNGLEGMNSDQIYDLQHGTATWNRPTWRMGVNSPGYQKSTIDPEVVRDFFKLFEETRNAQANTPLRDDKTPTAIRDACAVFGLTPPLDVKQVKKRYRELAKQHHPDVNQNSAEAEDLLKQVNHAYAVLLTYIEKMSPAKR